MEKRQLDTKFNRTVFLHFLFVVALIFFCTISSVYAEQDKNLSLYSSETCKNITERQSRLKNEIEKVKAAIALETPQETGSVDSVLKQKLAAYRKIDLIYEQQLLQLKSTFDLKQTNKRQKDEISIQASQQLPEKSSDTFLKLNELER